MYKCELKINNCGFVILISALFELVFIYQNIDEYTPLKYMFNVLINLIYFFLGGGGAGFE